jgi:hypothetical protein
MWPSGWGDLAGLLKPQSVQGARAELINDTIVEAEDLVACPLIFDSRLPEELLHREEIQ